MASLIPFFKGVANTVNRDVVQPVSHAIGNTVNAGATAARDVGGAAQATGRFIAATPQQNVVLPAVKQVAQSTIHQFGVALPKSVYSIGRGIAADVTNNPVALANANKAKQTNEGEFIQPFARPVVQIAKTISHPLGGASYQAKSQDARTIFGDKPIQNIQAGVQTNFNDHKNLPLPQRIALASAYGAGQVGQDALMLAGAKKGGIQLAKDVKDTGAAAVRGANKALDVAEGKPYRSVPDSLIPSLQRVTQQRAGFGEAVSGVRPEDYQVYRDVQQHLGADANNHTPIEDLLNARQAFDNKIASRNQKLQSLPIGMSTKKVVSTDPLAALKQEAPQGTFYKGFKKDGSSTGSGQGDAFYITPHEHIAKTYDEGVGVKQYNFAPDTKFIDWKSPEYKAIQEKHMLQVDGGEPGYRKPDYNAINAELKSKGYDAVTFKTPDGDSPQIAVLNKSKINENQPGVHDSLADNLPNQTGVKNRADNVFSLTQQSPESGGIISQTDLYNQAHADNVPAQLPKVTPQRDVLIKPIPEDTQLPTGQGVLSSPEQIGKALGLSDEQMKQAMQAETQRTVAPSPEKMLKPSDPATSRGYLSGNASNESLTPNIPEKQLGTGTYDVNKKVGIHDYLRTPEKVLDKIGLHNEGQKLLEADHTYKQTLPKEIDKISKWYDEVKRSPESSQNIFKKLDGQKVELNPTEAKVAGEMKQYLSDWADRLHLPKESRITNYITHIFDEKLVGKEFDPDLEKLLQDKVPGSVYDPFTQQRLGAKGYKEDAFQALDAYVKRAVRKESFDPALEQLKSAAEGLDKSGLNYVTQYAKRINMQPTELDNLIDNTIKQIPGVGYKLGQRPVAKLSRGIRQATYRAALGGNIGSAVRNLTQGVNTFAELGSRWTGVGYKDAIQALATKSDELNKAGVLDNSFIEDRTLSATKQTLQKVDKGLFAMFEAAERVNRGAAYFGAKARALSKGATEEEAMKAGAQIARKTQFTFGKVDTPVALQSDIAKLVTQFQSYNVKQAEFLGEAIKNKEFGKLLRYTGAASVVMLTVGKALGYSPTDFIPFGSNINNSQSPFAGTPAFKLGGDAIRTVQAGLKQPTSKTSRLQAVEKAGTKMALDVGSAVVPGFSQAKKTITGLQAVNKGQVQKGNQKFTVDQSTANKVKAGVFGPYTLQGPKSTPTVSIKNGNSTVTLSPKASDTFNNANDKKYNNLLGQLKQQDYYKSASPAQQKKYETTLRSTVTSQSKRDYSAANNIPLQKQATNNQIAVANNKLPQLNATKGSTGGVKIASNLDNPTKQFLTKYNSMSAADRVKAANTDNAYEYNKAVADYNNNLANGKLTTAQQITAQASIAKARVGVDYSKNVRDLYGLSKSQLASYLSSQGDKGNELYNQLSSYDQALYKAGIISTPKFKNGLTTASTGSKTSGSKRVAKFKTVSLPRVKASTIKIAKMPKPAGMKSQKLRVGKVNYDTKAITPRVRTKVKLA